MTTNTASGAADLRTAAQAVVDRWDTPLWKDVPATAEYIGRLRAALAAGQATAAQAVVQDDLITLRKPTTSAELLWLLKLAQLVISDVDKTLEETFAPAQSAAQQAGEPAGTVGYTVHGTQYVNWRTKPPAHGTPLYTTPQPTQTQPVTEPAKSASHGQAPAGAAPECLTCSDHGAVGNILTAEPCPDCTRLNTQQAGEAADSVPAVSDLPPLPAPDLRDVGTKPQEIKEFLKGYATEYARTAIAARAPAGSEESRTIPDREIPGIVEKALQELEGLVKYATSTYGHWDMRRAKGALSDLEWWARRKLAAHAHAQAADSVQEDAARYRLLRRGQHWSVIDGIGDDLLRAEALDAAVDAARKQGGAT